MVESDIQYADKHEDTVGNIQTKLEDIREFFKDLEGTNQDFLQIKRAGKCEGQVLPKQQLDTMDNRFHNLKTKCDSVQRKLEYEELRYRLLAFLVAAEAKLKSWTVKYGYQEDVELMLQDYIDFVEVRQLFEEYDNTYRDVKRRADLYKRQDSGNKKQSTEINKSLDEITERWKKLKVEITSTQSMLDEVVSNWKRYNACVDIFTVWLADAEQMMKKPPEERGDFFDNMEKWQEKLRVLKESSNFLVEVVQEPIAVEIKERVLFIDTRWQDINKQIVQFMAKQTAEKGQREYQVGIDGLAQWLTNAEELLKSELPCSHPVVREHVQNLDATLQEVERVESQFKTVSKTAQGMVKTSSQADIKQMLDQLRLVKERLVKVRRDLPERLKPLKTLLPHVESLEIGISDITRWVEDGEELLNTHRIDGNINIVEERLEKQKAYFSETTYYKSMLESKNKVYQKVSKTGGKYMNLKEVESTMVHLNRRFQECITRAKDWEQKLEKALRLWRNLQNKAKPIEEWVVEAEGVLSEEGDNIADLIASHRAFFDIIDQHMFEDFMRAGRDLLQILEDDDREELSNSIHTLQDRWKELQQHAPIRLIRLEFQQPEASFLQNIEVAEETLQQQKSALQQKGANVKEILRKHKVIFEESGLAPTCQQCLEEMGRVSKQLLTQTPDDNSLEEAHAEYTKRWHALKLSIEDLCMNLEEVPEKWRQYNLRLTEFIEWMDGVETTIKDLKRETISTQEYKQTLARFQQVVKNIDKHREDAKWLVKTLDELLANTPEEEARVEQAKLDAALDRYKALMPAIEITTTRSSIVVKCHDYKDAVEEQMEWLNEAEEKVREDLPLDDLASVRVLLDEQENVLAKLENQRPELERQIADGRALLRQGDTPEFLQDTVSILEDTVRETQTLAQIKYQSLKESLHNWEEYEGIKGHIVDFLKKAENESAKQPPVTGRESIQKELVAKQELLKSLEEMQPDLAKLREVNANLVEMASDPRQEVLQHEVSNIDGRANKLAMVLTQRVLELKSSDEKWDAYYGQYDNLSDWLNSKQEELRKIQESDLPPDQQFEAAKAIYSEILDKHAELEQLEKDGQELSKGSRSRETAAVKSKLTNMRRQFDTLTRTAKKESDTISEDVTHWNQYQNIMQQLLPWLENAEKYMDEKVGKVTDVEEAQQQADHHHGFLQERDENQGLYDQFVTEAALLADKPGVSQEMDDIQGRWGRMVNKSDDREKLLRMSLESWMRFNSLSGEIEEFVQKLDLKASTEPNVSTTEVQSLERDLGLYSALRNDLHANQKVLHQLAEQSEQVQPYLSPMGASEVTARQSTVTQAWTNLDDKVNQRCQQLEKALDDRRAFWNKFETLEKWVGKMQRRADSTGEVYSDEMGNSLSMSQALARELAERGGDVDALEAELEEMCRNCTPEERKAIMEQFQALKSAYNNTKDLTTERADLCEQWSEYSDTHRDCQNQIKALQQKLESQDLSQEDVAKINAELEAVQSKLAKWEGKRKDMEALMGNAQMTIKERQTQKTLHFQGQMQSLQNTIKKANVLLEQKRGKLDELATKWQEFDNLKDSLITSLNDLEKRVETKTIKQSTYDGVKALGKDIKSVESELEQHNSEYEEFRELARLLMASDSAHSSKAQSGVDKVNNKWEKLLSMISGLSTQLSTVSSEWTQFNETKAAVTKALAHVQPVLTVEQVFETQASAKRALDQYKSAELDLIGQQRQLDSLGTKGTQLIHDCSPLPGFDTSAVKEEVQNLQQQWQNTRDRLHQGKENLEEQMVFWEQITSSKEEVTTWLDNMVQKLEDNVQNFGDAVSVQGNLHKYKNELPYIEEAFETTTRKIATLQELNSDSEIPSLKELQLALDAQLAHAAELADQLDNQLDDFTGQKETLEGQISAESKVVARLRETIAKLDDITGDDEDILRRLNEAQKAKTELESHQGQIESLASELSGLQSKYHATEAAGLAKDISLLKKKFETTLQKANKVETTLQGAIEQHVSEAEQDQNRWLSSAKEKVAWCSDTSGDKYSIEAKLATIQELMNSVGQGEEKTGITAAKVELLKSAMPHSQKMSELDEKKTRGQTEFSSFIHELEDTKLKLESSMKQWQGYDDLYNDLNKWVKETEVKVRNDSGLQASLPSKQKQLDSFKNIRKDVEAHKPGIESMMFQAKDVAQSSTDSRVLNYAQQLSGRYQNLSKSVNEYIGKFEQFVGDHDDYLAKYRDCSDWLRFAISKLESCTDSTGEQDHVESRLDTIKEMMDDKDQGQGKFNSTVEAGEKLYPNTSTEGREVVRQELRSLRDDWESYVDGLNDASRRLEHSMVQWSSFNEHYDQLLAWLKDMEYQLTCDIEMKNSLPEKKTMLANYRSLAQEIQSHQGIISNVTEKGQHLESSAISSKITQLTARYQILNSTIKEHVKECEAYVSAHQQFTDTYIQTREWLQSLNEKLDVCVEPAADKHSIQNKLDRLQELAPTKQEGESRVAMVKSLSEKVLPQTAPPGQQTIRRELDSLNHDWAHYNHKLSDTKDGLEETRAAWNDFDGLYETLSKWLRDMEGQIKDYELKSTLQDKRSQVESFKDLEHEIRSKQAEFKSFRVKTEPISSGQASPRPSPPQSRSLRNVMGYRAQQHDIASKQPDFDNISVRAQNLELGETKMAVYTTQLNSRYQGLKSNVKDVISKWEGYVREHEQYESNYNSSMKWLNDLNKRLGQCLDSSGDRHVIEEVQTRLQELFLEKEQESGKIHLTIDLGEKLYPNTAVEGREIIRQQLRSLREKWESLSDQLSENQRQMEVSLVQLSSYDDSFEQFKKWLSDIEIKVKREDEAKASLQEKKIQLQSHKVQHQDIKSHDHVLDSLVERAQTLSQPRVKQQIENLSKQYKKLCRFSEDLLAKFENNVQEHQLYHDSYLECTDTLLSVREKMSAGGDATGDRFAIQNKLETIQEIVNQLSDCKHKVTQTSDLCDKTLLNTSMTGKEMLRREMSLLKDDCSMIDSEAEEGLAALRNVLGQWQEFEDTHEGLLHWLQRTELQLKESELKSNLEEKTQQVDRFKKLKEEIQKKQADVDKFTDVTQNLMQISNDMRLSTYVSQATNRYRLLHTNVKDLLAKWEKYVSEHSVYREKYNDFTKWLAVSKSKIDDIAEMSLDKDSLEQGQDNLQVLLGDKEEGIQRLNACIQYGEKLYPDTATAGREKIRQQLRTAKDVWDSLLGDMTEMQRKFDNSLDLWATYNSSAEELEKWILEVETWLKTDTELKNTLPEKKTQLQNNKALMQDVNSHGRVVDSVVEKAQTLLHSSQNPDVSQFIKDTKAKYTSLQNMARESIIRSEQHVSDHTLYSESYSAACEWLRLMNDRLTMCADMSGDKHSVTNKLDRVQDLISNKGDGEAKIRSCEEYAQATQSNTGLGGKQTIQHELEMLHQDWTQYGNDLTEARDRLKGVLAKWQDYELSYEKLAQWIKDMERKVKDFTLVATLEEKKALVKKYQDLKQDIVLGEDEIQNLGFEEHELQQAVRSRQIDVDTHADVGQMLAQTTSETRVTVYTSQLSTRYQSLLTSIKDILKKCDQNVQEHELFNEKYGEASRWLKTNKDKYAKSRDLSSSRDDLQVKQSIVQELAQEKDSGFTKLNSAVEAGEKLYPSTAADGRDSIRQQLRTLKQDWDTLFDEVMSSQRQLEVNLVQWTSFEESYDQLEGWLKNMEAQLKGEVPLHATFEDKKTQLQTYRNLCQDVLSYQRVIDSVLDKAQSLARSSSDPRVTKHTTQINERYSALCKKAKERVAKYEDYVRDHQQYHSAFTDCSEWIKMMKERLEMCTETTGDRHALQNRLERMEDVAKTNAEGEPKVRNTVSLSELLFSQTSPRGQEAVHREVEILKGDWDEMQNRLTQARGELEQVIQQWQDYEDHYERCASWIKEAETQVRSIDLKATLPEKQECLQRLRGLNDDLTSYQADIDEVTDKAQTLQHMSGDSRVASQTSQLTTRYQSLSLSIKEMLRRWDQFVVDHQSYDDAYHNCSEWQKDIANRLASCSASEGDKFALQNKLTKVQELMTCRDEGFHKLQQTVDSAHLVQPNSSTTGKDKISEDIQKLRQTWDNLVSQMNESKNNLETAVSQWDLYDDTTTHLSKWLADMQNQIKLEGGLQASLPEKRAQLERIKVMQMNVTSQQAAVNNLKEKAKSLAEATKDPQMASEATQLVKRYEVVAEVVNDFVRRCEQYVSDHQAYQDVSQDARDFLNAGQDKLVICSDIRGDRHSLISKKEKLDDLVKLKSEGQAKLQAASEKGKTVIPNTSARGQDVIRAELKSLSDDFEGWMDNVSETSSLLDKTLQQWKDFDETYSLLSTWLKVMEDKVKGVVELKTKLEEKERLYEQYHRHHEEVVSKQPAFDELSDKTQFLLQSSTDSRITAQLTQLNSRYTSLMVHTKDTMKKLEQHLEDHRHYKTCYQKCVSWLETNNKRLSACGDTSGNKENIQAQLENLHEFIALKEEGQSHIHAANTWGDKTMSSSSLEGRDMIQAELASIQRDWDAFLSAISDTRMALESCLLQWSDFDDSSEQIQRWLKDMERRLKDSEPRSDLSEKKAQLQRFKGLSQDIAAYEHMIESVKSKAKDLTSKSQGSRLTTESALIVDRYENIVDKVKESVTKHGQEVADHQAFQEACNTFLTWLRSAREKLATCSDTYGDKATIHSKIDKLRAMETDKSAGSEMLGNARAAAERVIPSTARSGHPRIEQELQILNQDITDFQAQIDTSLDNLVKCLGQWEEFEKVQEKFTKWLTETSADLKMEVELKTNLLEKEEQQQAYQARHNEVLSHQTEMDSVSQKAQSLLEINSDARVSHSITQMTTKYQALLSSSKEALKKAETQCNEHRNYNTAADDFNTWLNSTKEKVSVLNNVVGTKEELESRLTRIRELQTALDHGHAKLKTFSDQGDRVLPKTNSTGCQTIREQIEYFRVEYDKLRTQMVQGKHGIESMISNWSNFDRTFEQLNQWVKETEMRAKTDSGTKADLAEKKAHLEKMKMLNKDITLHQGQMDNLQEKCAQLEEPNIQATVSDIVRRFEGLKADTATHVTALEQHVAEHEKYKTAYNQCTTWALSARQQTQHLLDASGSKDEVQRKLSKLQDMRDSLADGESLFRETQSMSQQVLDNTSPAGCDRVKQEMMILKEEMDGLQSTLSEADSGLGLSISSIEAFESEHDSFVKWLSLIEDKVKSSTQSTEFQAPAQVEATYENLHEEIVSHKPDLERLTAKCETVLQRTSDPAISTSVMQLATRYQSLQATAKSEAEKQIQESSKRLEEFLRDQRAYQESHQICLAWLENIRERLAKCDNTIGDMKVIQNRIDTVKDIISSFEEGFRRVNNTCEQGQKLLPRANPESRGQIEAEITAIRKLWDTLQQEVNECSGKLEGQLNKWQTHSEVYISLQQWLDAIESELKMGIEPKAELTEKRGQLEKFKSLLSSLNNRHEQMEELQGLVGQLKESCPDKNLAGQLSELQQRHQRAQQEVKENIDNLETACELQRSYRDALQECEKWILQMSFKLMSHNTLDVSTIERTQQHIQRHQELIEEIDAYQSELEKVRELGQELINESHHLPSLVQQTEIQLSNTDESYLSLQATAMQIKERLAEVLNKWEQYSDLLYQCDGYIKEEVRPWLTEVEKSPATDSVSQARQQNTTKDMLEKLYKFKQDITTAANKCENLASDEDNKEERASTPLYEKASKVNDSLIEVTESLENAITKMRESGVQWEAAEKMKVDLLNWLMSRTKDVSQMEEKPAKLHLEAAELEISHLEELMEEIKQKEAALDKLKERYTRLCPHDPNFAESIVGHLRQEWSRLIQQLEEHMARRREFMERSRAYHQHHATVNTDIDQIQSEVERVQTMEDAALQDRVDRLQGRNTSVSFRDSSHLSDLLKDSSTQTPSGGQSSRSVRQKTAVTRVVSPSKTRKRSSSTDTQSPSRIPKPSSGRSVSASPERGSLSPQRSKIPRRLGSPSPSSARSPRSPGTQTPLTRTVSPRNRSVSPCSPRSPGQPGKYPTRIPSPRSRSISPRTYRGGPGGKDGKPPPPGAGGAICKTPAAAANSRRQRKLPDIHKKCGLLSHTGSDSNLPRRSHSPASRRSADSGRSTPRSLRSLPHSTRSSRSSLRRPRKLPKPNSSTTASAEWETDDSESGFVDTIHAPSTELLSPDDLALIPDLNDTVSPRPHSILEVQPGRFFTPAVNQSNSRAYLASRTVFGVTFAEPENRTFPPGEETSDESEQRNSSNSTFNGSQDDVVQAILEADRAMQEMMASGTVAASQFRVQPDQLDSWYQNSSEGVTVENGEPVRVLLLDHDAQTSSLTDSAKEALKKSPGTQQNVTTVSSSGGQVTRISMIYDDEDDREQQAEERLSPEMWIDGHQAGSPNRRQIEVVQHEVDVTRHVLKPNTELESDEETSIEENGHLQENLDDTLDNEDAMSWPSGVTEPEPDTVSSTCDSGTQTLRHRKTQTQAVEDGTTQTPAFQRRRKLPLPPGNSSAYDTDGTESLISMGSNEQEPSAQRSEGAFGTVGSTQTRQTGVNGRKSRKLPAVNGYRADQGSESDEFETNPSLLNTMRLAGSGSRRSSTQMSHRSTGGNAMEGSMPLRATRDTVQQPQYIQEYQQYIEAFDGTESGPFVPTSRSQNEAAFNEDGTIISRGHGAQTPTQLHSQRNFTSLLNTMPQDSAGEAGYPRDNMMMHQTIDDLYNRSTQTSPLMRPRNFSTTSDGSGRRRPMSAGNLRTDSDKEKENQRPPTAIAGQAQSPGTPGRVATFDRLFSGDPQHRPRQAGPGAGTGKARSWDVIAGDGNFSDGSTRDFTQQTPLTHSTQTPLRIMLGASGESAPRGTITMGDTFVFESDPSSHPVLQPWSVISPLDLDITAARDFATQTFGQMYTMSHSHAETQTAESEVAVNLVERSFMTSSAAQLSNSERLVTVADRVLTPRQNIELARYPEQQAAHANQHSARPNEHMPFQAYQPSTSCSADVVDHSHSSPMAHTPKKGRDISPASKHAASEREEAPMDGSQEKPKRQHKKEKPKTRSPERNIDRQSTITAGSNISRKDLLKLMLSQVKQLRRQVDPEPEDKSKSHRESKEKKRSKSKEKSKHRERSDERETLDDPDKLYNKRRLEMMYSRPQTGAAEVDSSRPRRRRHSIESYHSEKYDHIDAGRSAREHYQKFREQYIPKSRWSYSRDDAYFSRPRERVPPRQALTPPPVPRRGPPPYKYLHERPGTASLMGRDLPPHRRQLPQVPVRERSFAPPQYRQMRPLMPGHMMQGQHPPQQMMAHRMGHPVQMMPPQAQVMNTGPGVPMQAPPQVQLGQGAFRPISMQEAQQMGTPAQQGTPVVLLPPNHQVPPSPHAPYIVIASPYRYESVSDSAPEGEVRKSRSRKPRSDSPRHVHAGTPLDKATKAAREMRNLTEKLNRSTPMK